MENDSIRTWIVKAEIDLSYMGYFCNFVLPHKVYYKNGLMTFICNSPELAKLIEERAIFLADK
jgi:hypothetical protein